MQKKKLTLKRTTIRDLTKQQLSGPAGGELTTPNMSCATCWTCPETVCRTCGCGPGWTDYHSCRGMCDELI
jgi:hypothetical protein